MMYTNSAVVYWIHLDTHENPFLDGYIGVTKQQGTKRYIQHCSDAKHGRHLNEHLGRSIRKYQDRIIYTILVVASEEYCYNIEQKLRPNDGIGWNLVIGGSKPPSPKNKKLNEFTKNKLRKPKSPEHKENIRLAKLGDRNPNYGKSPSYETIEKRRETLAHDWYVISPNGEVFEIKNLNKFCVEHGLISSALYHVAKGKRPHHRGWKVRKGGKRWKISLEDMG